MTHISLALVGLMWVFPFLYYRHEYPLTTFYQEWGVALLGLLSMTILTAQLYRKTVFIPKIVMLPLVLIAIVGIQFALGKIEYFEQAMLYLLYLLLSAMLMVLAAGLRHAIGLEKVATVLATALLIGTELSACIGIYQYFELHSWLDSVILMRPSGGLYGNMAQANHYANYIAMGVVSLGWLLQQRKLGRAQAFMLAFPLLFVMMLSGSRTTWLYIAAMMVMSGAVTYKDKSLRSLLYFSVTILLGYVAMYGLVQWLAHLNPAEVSGHAGSFNSLRTSDTSGYIRLYLWREALEIFQQSPWLGVGFGQYAIHHFELQPTLQLLLHPREVMGLYNNAHNIVMQLAAETGVAGLLTFLASLLIWAWGLKRTSSKAALWWCAMLVIVIGIHSLLEYPLWYAYFLAILSFVLGMSDEKVVEFELTRSGVLGLGLLLVVACVVVVQLRYDYLKLQSALVAQAMPNQAVSSTPYQALNTMRDSSGLMRPYVDFYLSNYISVDEVSLERKLVFNRSALRYIPGADQAYRQAYLEAQAGDLGGAKQTMLQALWSYPNQPSARNLLINLARRDPPHFAALLEFAVQKEQEIARAVRNN